LIEGGRGGAVGAAVVVEHLPGVGISDQLPIQIKFLLLGALPVEVSNDQSFQVIPHV